MADIVHFPLRDHGLDHTARLCAELAEAHARGQNLGSRASHIQLGGERLHELSRALRDTLDGLDRALDKAGLQDRAAMAGLRQLQAWIDELADRARNFRSAV